jgi:hypothetical protein
VRWVKLFGTAKMVGGLAPECNKPEGTQLTTKEESVPVASRSIHFSTPQDGDVFWKQPNEAWINVSGSVTFVSPSVGPGFLEGVSVSLGSGGFKSATIRGNEWSYRGRVTAEGSLTITVVAAGLVGSIEVSDE